MNTAAVAVAPKSYRLNGECACGKFCSRAFVWVGKASTGRSTLRDVDTGAEVIGHNVVVTNRLAPGRVLKRWQVSHTCACGKTFTLMPVAGIVSPDHKCDARCESARGHSCECACGGANHGRAA